MHSNNLWSKFAAAPKARAFYPVAENRGSVSPVDGPDEIETQDKLASNQSSILCDYVQKYHLEDLQAAIQTSKMLMIHNQRNRPVFDVLLSVDPLLLSDHCTILGEQLITGNSFTDLQHLFTTACAEIIAALLNGTRTTGTDGIVDFWVDQVRLTLRIDYLPSLEDQNLTPRNLFDRTRKIPVSDCSDDVTAMTMLPLNQFVRLRGTVIGISVPSYHKYGQTFGCNNIRCRNRNSLQISRITATMVRYVKRDETGCCLSLSTRCGIHEIDRMCGTCGLKMDEIMTDGVYVIEQQILVADLSTKSASKHVFTDHIFAILCDDLAEAVRLGNKIEIVGAASRTETEQLCVRVNNLFILSDRFEAEEQSVCLEPLAYISRLIDSGFLWEITGPNALRKVRFYMLLSMASLNVRTNATDDYPAKHLLNFLALVDSKSVDLALMERMMLSAGASKWNPASTSSRKQIDSTQVEFIDRDIAQSYERPCYVKLPISGFKNIKCSALAAIISVINRHQWATIGSNEDALVVPTNSCFWSAIPLAQSPFTIDSMKPELRAFIDQWQLIVLVTGDDSDIAAHILSQEITTSHKPHSNYSRKFTFVPSPVEMTAECTDLIRECFLEFRRSDKRVVFEQLDLMFSVCAACAKLCSRTKTCINDALVAAIVSEDLLHTKYDVVEILSKTECLNAHHEWIEAFKRAIMV